MLNILADHNGDIRRLQHEGFTLEVRNNHLVIRDIPYVNSKKEIKKDGVLVTPLELTGNKINSPIRNHVIHFQGDHPSDKNGNVLLGIKHCTKDSIIGEITCNHSFSNKPRGGYKDYYEKVTTYADVISSHAKSIDSTVTPKQFKPVRVTPAEETVFLYRDTYSSIAGIGDVNNRCKGLKVALIGLGGTGSYVLDHLAKTEIEEIHLYDGDILLQHNVFRTPGGISLEEFQNQPYKTDFLAAIYSKLRKGILSFPEYIKDSNIKKILQYDFVFINMDSNEVKRDIVNLLVEKKIPFIDTGIGLEISTANKISGIGRVTYCDKDNVDHLNKSITYAVGDDEVYGSNIQTPEINSLTASFAVIEFKKYLGIYEGDLDDRCNNLKYDIDFGRLIRDKD